MFDSSQRLEYDDEAMLNIDLTLPGWEDCRTRQKGALEQYVSKLCDCDPSDISEVLVERAPRIHKEICVRFSDNTFLKAFLKKSWEGAVTESLGMEAPNCLLGDEVYSYVSDGKEVILENWAGDFPLHKCDQYVSEDILKNYAMALEMAYSMGLGDRHAHNFLVDDNNYVRNIDFGFLFFEDTMRLEPPVYPVVAKRFDKYRTTAREVLRNNFESSKGRIESLTEEALSLGVENEFEDHIVFSSKMVFRNPLERITDYLHGKLDIPRTRL